MDGPVATEHVYLNGRLVAADEARVGVFDAGLLHGVGLFETMRAYNGVVFRLDDHLERLRRSAAALKIALPGDLAPWKQGVSQLLEANGLTSARVRLMVTPGDVRRAAQGGGQQQTADCTVLIAAGPMTPYPAEMYQKGMTVLVSGFKQGRYDPMCGHKTISYFPRLIALRDAQMRGCGEALWFTTENLLAEGSISNVFLVKDELLKTPPVDTPILPGVARKVVLEQATAQKISFQELPLTVKDLLGADEVFLTNSVMEVMPVCRVEAHTVGDEKPGPITQRVAEAYRGAVKAGCGGEG
jgi:branched-chain amino acid aminotransferase